jgi:ATP-binding cassette subfamily B protein
MFYLLISRYTTKKFLFNGKVIASEIPKQHTTISGSFRSFKDMVLDNIQGLFISNFVSSIKKIRKITVSNIFLSQAPRYLLEGFVMCIIAGYLLILYNNGHSQFSSISTIAFIAAAGQRLLPIINAFYSNFQSLNSNNQSLEDILKTLLNKNKISKFNEELNKPINPFPFKKSIEFKNVSFKYSNKKKLVLKNVSFTINKGEKVALIGPSGFGKTTLVDLLMGLLKPSSGEILVDGINIRENINGWKTNLSCVSQDPFFFNTSIKNNIRLFNKDGNKRNYLNNLIEFFELKKIIKISNVGDNGSLISGGQKQRIALARTYFKKRSIVILDEATNALDIRLEKKILRRIVSSVEEHTLIIIAHRKESISLCNKVIDLSKINKA